MNSKNNFKKIKEKLWNQLQKINCVEYYNLIVNS